MNASSSCSWMDSRAPVSSTERASLRCSGGDVGVGRRASRVRRCRLALERREVICEAGGGGLEFSSERIEVRDDTGFDMAGGECDVDRWGTGEVYQSFEKK